MDRYAIVIPSSGAAVLLHCDEGKLMELPVNEAATDVSALLYDYICGEAVLMGARGEELIGFTRKAAENIVKKWRLADDEG